MTEVKYVCSNGLSIHDLTRRSTYDDIGYSIRIYTFNSRPHKEVDKCHYITYMNRESFNSRPHKEVDNQIKISIISIILSIHDLTRRSTWTVPGRVQTRIFFQFTTSQGGRRQIPTIIANICIHYSLFCINLSFLHYFIFNFRITFPLCGSHIRCESLDIFCPLHIRTKELSSQSHQNRVLFQYVPLCFYTYLLDYKTADCPLPYL